MGIDRSEGGLGTADLAGLIAAVGSIPPPLDDADRIDRIRQFEQLKSAVAAAQAAETSAFVLSQRDAQAAAGVPAERRDRGIASQVALARRTSLHAAQRYTGWSVVLVRELPHTFAALRAGLTSEWRAQLIARETIFLSRADRAAVDAELGPRLATMSDRKVETEARAAGYRLDPAGSLARTRNAAEDRRVTVRPAPDTMVRLTALLPVAQGVACYASLSRTADTSRSAGDPRTRGQLMADALVERLTGQATADAVPVEIELVVSVDTLFARDDVSESDAAQDDVVGGPPTQPFGARGSPALITAPGQTPTPIPDGLARDLVARAPRAWLRRLFTFPNTSELTAMETHRRLFTESQRRFVRHRDQYCATPWCGAPIRHIDHVVPAAHGGATHLDNARGLCEACNYAVQASGWHHRVLPDGGIETTTPTGHSYTRSPARSRPAA